MLIDVINQISRRILPLSFFYVEHPLESSVTAEWYLAVLSALAKFFPKQTGN